MGRRKKSKEEGAESFLPQRHFISLFHRTEGQAKNGDVFIQSSNQSDSQIKEDYFTNGVFSDELYPLNSSQAREDKIQLGYHWKNGRFVIKTQKNLDFTNTTSRLDTAYLKRDLLETNFQQTYFFAPYFEIDFQSKWEEFNNRKNSWGGRFYICSIIARLIIFFLIPG